ncbi:MAG: hypothetical protein EOM25_02045 [Deltaproteobacteria bacterium]|nr:hypothetical protein [Deltaproteobacteria bacterium]
MLDLRPQSHTRAVRTVARMLALMAIFMVSGLLFWQHSNRSMEKILDQQVIFDQTNTLEQDRMTWIKNMGRMLRTKYGLMLTIKITHDLPQPPTGDRNTVFIGLSPDNRRLVIELPPLVGRAIGLKFVEDMKNDMSEHFEADTWPEGLVHVLERFFVEMEAVYERQPES